MINTSNEYKTVIKGARNMYADVSIVFRDGTKLPVDQDGLWGLSIEDNVSGTDSFDVGSAIINQLTLKLDNTDERYNAYNFDGAKITVKIGLQLSKTVEWLNKGVFTADPGEYTGDTITVKAYDNMKKFDRKYSESKLVYPATLGSIVRDACSVCGVSLSTTSFPLDSFVVQTRPTDEALTFREVLTWVGQIACLWCRCNVHGALELGWYDLKGYEDETGHFFEIEDLTSSSISTDDVVITGVKVIQETETDDETVKTEYLSGTEGYILSIEGNDLIQGQNGRTVADSLGEKLIGLRFRKLSVTHKSDPSMEAGDLCRVTDWRGRTYKTLVTGTNFQFGNNQKTECSAETPSRNNADRFSQQTKNYVKLRKQVSAEKTAREKAIEDLTNALAASSGLYITTVKQSDGSSIYYMHNKPVLEESDIVWKITAEAFGISTDGGKTYPFGFQVTGEMVAKLLAVDGINASWINTGIFRIADKSGNEVLYADVDTGIVRINAQNITIGGEPIASEKYVSDKLQSLNVLNIILSNDYYSVPVDAQGVIPSGALAGADTIVTVLWGAQDITANVKIVITESAGVSGTWTDDTKRYAVSDLTEDNAWVDFSVTYNGVNLVKRYTIVKRYPGADGEAGKSFQLGCSVNTVKRAKQGELLPHYLDFESYYFDTDVKRKGYAGRFVVEESSDGLNWIPCYTSTNVGYVDTMRGLCPEAVAGKTYVLNCNISNSEASRHIYLLATGRAIAFGKAFEWSDEMLDDKIAWYNSVKSNNENVISEIQFEEGTAATSYEPYTDGKPSPSPDFPQEIVSAGDTGNIEVDVTGKNLVNIQDVTVGWAQGIQTSLDDLNKHVGETITITAIFDVISVSNKVSDQYVFQIYTLNTDNEYRAIAAKKLSIVPKVGDRVVVQNVTKLTKKIQKMLLYAFGNDHIGTLGTSKATVQIELGGVATPYKPFEKETLNLITPNGLPGIPVDLDGNYTDENGQQWICDEVDFERRVYIQRIGIADQDSFSTIIWTTGAICFVNLKANTLQTRYAMTTISAVYRPTWVPSSYATHFTQTISQKLIIVLPNTITTKEQGEEIRQKGFKFAYILGKPIETPLSPEEITAYKSLTTHKTTTIISNDAGAGMEVTYVADPKTYIDNKFAELSQAIVASASEAE